MDWDELEEEAAREDRARHLSDAEDEGPRKRKGGGSSAGPAKRR